MAQSTIQAFSTKLIRLFIYCYHKICMLQAETKQSEGEETDSTFVTQPKVLQQAK